MRRARGTTTADRTILVVLGGALVAGGVLAALVLVGQLGPRPDAAGWLQDVAMQPWWPIAAVAGGVLLALAALWWALAHRPGESIKRLALAGSSYQTRLQVRPEAATAAANAALSQLPDVRAARLRLVLSKGRIEVHGSVSVARDVDIVGAATHVVSTVGDLATALGMTDIHSHVHIAVDR